MLFNEPKLLKFYATDRERRFVNVSVLFNEPKLLKSSGVANWTRKMRGFSALQRAEIAEIVRSFGIHIRFGDVSVLFNEPKLLKCRAERRRACNRLSFSALQRAEIAEMSEDPALLALFRSFQCSSTSRNC